MIIIWLLIIFVIIGILVALALFGKKMQKKQEEYQKIMNNNIMEISVFVINKKKMKIQNAGFPKVVVNSVPKYAKMFKMPVVKAKIGPKIVTLLCDKKIFKELPVNRECKVGISGIYICKLKSIRSKKH